MIETASASPPFKSAVMPTSGNSCASSCAPMSGPNTSTVASQPSCCLLNVSKKAFHSSRGISRVGIIAPYPLHTRRECFGWLARLPQRVSLKRFERTRLVQVNDGVELLRQACIEVVTLSLRLRQIDDADGALKARPAQSTCGLPAIAQGEQKPRQSYVVKQSFIAARQARTHTLALRRLVPIRGGRHSARVGCEPDEHCFTSVM